MRPMPELEIVKIPTDELVEYENNAKLHSLEQIDQIAASIQEFGFNSPILAWHNDDGEPVIVAGHGRLMAAQSIGLDELPVVFLDHMSDEQRRAYTLVDNQLTMNSGFDIKLLTGELEGITGIDMSQFDFDVNFNNFEFDDFDSFSEFNKSNESDEFDSVSADTGKTEVINGDIADDEEHSESYVGKGNNVLVNRFLELPFSILDAKSGRWQDRKHAWLELTGNLSETRDGDNGRTFGEFNGVHDNINGGTSNFDPVLAELMYKWFCVDEGKILDPFGGEQTKGVVAGELGYRYTGVEIRQEQVELNNEKTRKYSSVSYVCGDSNDISKLISDRDFDMCLTSPPYYDLEVYSADDMSALGTYDEFIKQYANILSQCYEMLKEDSFLVIKVGEIRDKKNGQYRNFVGDTIRVLLDAGFSYYDEIILSTIIGTAALRATKNMRSRKIAKVHQNVLVFYKGNTKNIKNKFKEIDFSEKEKTDEVV